MSPLELLQELVIVGVGQLDVPLRKNVPDMNIILISMPSNLRGESSGIPG